MCGKLSIGGHHAVASVRPPRVSLMCPVKSVTHVPGCTLSR